MTASLISIRHWRYPLVASALTVILFLAQHNALYVSSSTILPIKQLGLQAFLAEQTALLDNSETIKHDPYKVPAAFAEGTRANMQSSLFPLLTLGHAFHPMPLPKQSILGRPHDPPVAEMKGEAFNPAILKIPKGIAAGWEYVVVARGPRVERRDIWVPSANRHAEEHGLVA